MGIDGFSMGNLIQSSEMSPVQIAGEAERLAAKESKYEVKTLNESAKEGGVKRKEEDADSESAYENEAENNNNQASEQEINSQEVSDIIEQEIENGNLKNFELKLNEITDDIELLNKKEARIMEKINAQDLMNVLKKVNHSSGIFVNKKI